MTTGRVFHFENFGVVLPTGSPFYEKALAHIRKENLQVSEDVDLLPKVLEAHGEEVNSAEADLSYKINERLSTNGLLRDRTGTAFSGIIAVLEPVWREYVKTLDQSRLLMYFQRSFPWGQKGDELWAGTHRVWKGPDTEKSKMMESLESLVIDDDILEALGRIESSKSHIEQRIKRINDLAAKISKEIDVSDYKVKVKGCCGSWWD
jgi:hypothetical protein